MRSRVGFSDHIPILLNGEFLLNGALYLSAIALGGLIIAVIKIKSLCHF